MPLYKKRLPSGATVLRAECEVCGKNASFGENVDLGKKKAGEWYCKEHKPK